MIKEKWLSCHDSDKFTLNKSDCQLFLRIVRQIIISSRDENSNIVDIYKRIEDRSDKEIKLLKNHIFELQQLINEQKELIQNQQICLTSKILAKTEQLMF